MDIQHPETQLTDEVDEGEEDFEELLPDYYVQKSTSMIFECKFFDSFVLVRPATPRLYLAIKKISHREFMDTFEEFYGDKDQVRDIIRGKVEPELLIH